MDEDILNFFTKKWEEYQFSSKVLNGFCSYLNRHWVKRQNESGSRDIYCIYNVNKIFSIYFYLNHLYQLK
jgi:cullin 1